jgi:[protein-PII] uridylyltransferase
MGAHLPPAVVHARQQLAEGRAKLGAQHDRGSPGIQVCAHQTDLLDAVLLDLYEAAIGEFGAKTESIVCLVALGGYGRRDVAPFSDVDLMLLVEADANERVAPFVRRLTQDITDSGLQLGCSVRTPKEAVSLALKDATVFTSLVETRYLKGNADLFSRFTYRFRRRVTRRSASLIRAVEEARRTERRQFGETVYLLEPNVKRSPGGLRELQFLRWVGFARYGEAAPEHLEGLGMLPTEDRRKLRAAREFLLRLRNELHFHSGKSQDNFDKSEQLRLSQSPLYEGTEALLPVEQLMREYIEHTSEVRYIVAHFVASAKRQTTLTGIVDPLLGHRVGDEFRVGPLHIRATKQGLLKVSSDLAETLRLMDLSNRYNVRIDHPTWQAVRTAMIDRPNLEVSPQAAQRFLSVLSQPARLGNLLRQLHELRVLEKLIPPMAHARCLMQFNDYHKFTVDEHSIRAVEAATEFRDDPGTLGDAYRGLCDKRMLHLALLVHDLGKGHPEDHSELGSRLAKEVGEHLGLAPRDSETLQFLVLKHLMMSHLAQRRDVHDDSVVVEFAVEVGSTEVLQILYLLTCADLAAVGPGVLNRWKLELITHLYRRAREYLGGEQAAFKTDNSLTKRREELRHIIARKPASEWLNQRIADMPGSYLLRGSAEDIAGELSRLHDLRCDDVAAWAKYLPEQNTVEFTVGAYEQITAGIFHKLTGALAGKGMQILSAEIHTLADNLALDRFHVLDPDYASEPTTERLNEVSESLIAALKDRVDRQPKFRRRWADRIKSPTDRFTPLPTRIQIDNSTSAQFTILDIFAHDQMGLLYTISRAIFELGLSVHAARIGTYLDQVVDVFYVTDEQNRKLYDERRLTEIREQLLSAIESHSTIVT